MQTTKQTQRFRCQLGIRRVRARGRIQHLDASVAQVKPVLEEVGEVLVFEVDAHSPELSDRLVEADLEGVNALARQTLELTVELVPQLRLLRRGVGVDTIFDHLHDLPDAGH